MASPMQRTATPGIFKRGGRYVVVFRDPYGRQRKRSARTLAEARDLKAALTADVTRGEYRATSKVTFARYAPEWIDTYAGRTARGILDTTRADYRKQLELDAIPFFGTMPLAAIEPGDIRRYALHVAARGVKPNTVRLALAPVKALLATAYEDGLIRANPSSGVRIVLAREQFDEGGDSQDEVKVLSPAALAELLRIIEQDDGQWAPFFRFLADTGLRIGEAIELRWKDVDLGRRVVRVRRRFYRGRVGAPKSKYGRRQLRLTPELARTLWTLRGDAGENELVWTAEQGGRVDQSNLMSRVLKPAAVKAGLGEWVRDERGRLRAESWVGFHTFRHTCATSLFRAGWNAVQVQRWLGHHKPSFTVDTYIHLLEGDTPEPIDVVSGNSVATRPREIDRDAEQAEAAQSRMAPRPASVALEVAASS